MFSPIGLCCISLKQKGLSVNEQQIFRLFADAAHVSKVLVFQKEPTLKCFIEFSDTCGFEKALRTVGSLNSEFGKVSLYHSKKESLKNAVEFPAPSLPPRFHKPSTNLTDLSDTSSVDGVKPRPPGYFDPHNPFASLLYDIEPIKHQTSAVEDISTLNPSQLFHFNKDVSPTTDSPEQPDPSHLVKPTVYLNQKDIHPSEMPFLIQSGSFTQLPSTPASRPSTVLLITNYTLLKKYARFIMNILGCFGNLVRLVVNYSHNRFYVEMENAHQTNLVSIYLEDFNLFGSKLTVTPTLVTSLKKPDFHLDNIEFYEPNCSQHRFKRHLSIKFNPPSKILHFTSLPSQIDHLVLWDLVRQVHEPLSIYKLCKSTRHSNMYLVEFSSAEESIHVLAVLHNLNVNNRPIKISFSHPEI